MVLGNLLPSPASTSAQRHLFLEACLGHLSDVAQALLLVPLGLLPLSLPSLALTTFCGCVAECLCHWWTACSSLSAECLCHWWTVPAAAWHTAVLWGVVA